MKYQIIAKFEDGITANVERHTSLKRAQAAVNAMTHANERELAEGYGFPHGVPTYEIVKGA